MNIYTCDICLTPNGAQRLHCQCCGTIPAQYSPTGKSTIYSPGEYLVPDYRDVVVAYGAVRLESRRAHKVYHRTVPLDYYATE